MMTTPQDPLVRPTTFQRTIRVNERRSWPEVLQLPGTRVELELAEEAKFPIPEHGLTGHDEVAVTFIVLSRPTPSQEILLDAERSGHRLVDWRGLHDAFHAYQADWTEQVVEQIRVVTLIWRPSESEAVAVALTFGRSLKQYRLRSPVTRYDFDLEWEILPDQVWPAGTVFVLVPTGAE